MRNFNKMIRLSRRQLIRNIQLLAYLSISTFFFSYINKKNPKSLGFTTKKLANSSKLVLNVKDFLASGSSREYKCKTITENSFIFISKHDFKVGQGIKIFGLGLTTKLSRPSTPQLSISGHGILNTLYSYSVAYIDKNGSVTEASLPSTIMNIEMPLNEENFISIVINDIPHSVAAIALYRSINKTQFELLNIFGNQTGVIRDKGNLKHQGIIKGLPLIPPLKPEAGYLVSTIVRVNDDFHLEILDQFDNNFRKNVLVVHDDTKSIQQALNVINTSNGGELFIPPGTYLVGQLRCGSEIKIYGVNRRTWLKRQHLVLDGNHWADNGILNNQLDLKFNNNGIFSGKSKKIIIENICFDGNYYNNVASGDWASAALLNIQGCENVLVRSCSFVQSVNAGFDLSKSQKVVFSYNYSGFHGKIFEHSAEPGIFGGCDNLNIMHNTFENCTDGINLIGVNNAIINLNKVRNCAIGFDLWGATNSKITNNTILGNFVNAISVFLEGNKLNYLPSSYVEISDNIIDGTIDGSHQTNTAILLIDALNWKIERNKIINCVHGIGIYRSQAPNSQSGNHLITQNLISNIQGSGITIGDQNFGCVSIINNKIIKSNIIYNNNFGGITLLRGNRVVLNMVCNVFNYIYVLDNAWLDIVKVTGQGNHGKISKIDSQLSIEQTASIRKLFDAKKC